MMEITRRNKFLFAAVVVVTVLVVSRPGDNHLSEEVEDKLNKLIDSRRSQKSCNKETDWSSISVDQMTTDQMFQYLHWSNSQACSVYYDFGGAVFFYNYHSIDGQKAVCMDPGLRPISGQCLVYSFGINNEWSFDKMFDSYGCQIYSFDPSMAMNDSDYTPKIHFHKMGLSHEDTDNGPKGWKMRTLDSIYKMLEPKHGAGAVIDYLKVDIESSEWKMLQQVFTTGVLGKVKQIGMELHFMDQSESDFRDGIRILKQMEDSGWVRFSSRVNVYMNNTIPFLGRTEYYGYEMAWYNNNFKL